MFEASKNPLVSPVSIYETHKLSLEKEGKTVAELRTATINKEFTVVNVSSEIAEEGARIGHRLRVSMADALIMATAKNLGAACANRRPALYRGKEGLVVRCPFTGKGSHVIGYRVTVVGG